MHTHSILFHFDGVSVHACIHLHIPGFTLSICVYAQT